MNTNAEIANSKTYQVFKEIKSASAKEITWSVRNLTSFPENPNYVIDSRHFVFQNATWCLRLYPNGKDVEGSCIGLTIARISSCASHQTLRYHLFSEESLRNVHNKVFRYDEDHTESGEMQFISRHVPYTSPPARRDSIKVTCIATCSVSEAVDTFSQTEFSVVDAKDVGSLCHDLKNMLLNGQNHDLTLIVKGKEFRAHRDLLRARSSVFEAMLSHDMIEKNSGVVDIDDCDPSAFEKFLVYLYSGPVDTLDSSTAPSLYSLAEKYGVALLKQVCRDSMKESLTASNFTGVVKVALEHDDAGLLRCATDYFVREVDEILPTQEWLTFLESNPVQANELFMKAREYTTDSKKMPRKRSPRLKLPDA